MALRDQGLILVTGVNGSGHVFVFNAAASDEVTGSLTALQGLTGCAGGVVSGQGDFGAGVLIVFGGAAARQAQELAAGCDTLRPMCSHHQIRYLHRRNFCYL